MLFEFDCCYKIKQYKVIMSTQYRYTAVSKQICPVYNHSTAKVSRLKIQSELEQINYLKMKYPGIT